MNTVSSSLRPTALLAERSVEQRHLIAGYLERHGWRVVSASDSVDALKLISARTTLNVTVFILNWRMPRVNGVDLIEWLKRMRPGTPVIFISTSEEMARWDSSIVLIRRRSQIRDLLARLKDVLESAVPDSPTC